MRITNKQLIEKAASIVHKRDLSPRANTSVGCALVTSNNTIFVGVNVHCACDIGFCSEHNAIGSMITQGESHIKKIVAVNSQGIIYPPCGRCREFMLQVNPKNNSTSVIVSKNKVMKLHQLLPYQWEKR
jgi:cytidine deaminase